MCEKCKERAARIPKNVITAIEAHKAELLEVLADINDAANPEIDKKKLTREEAGMLFSTYVIGYILGLSGANKTMADDHSSVDLFIDGVQAGADILNSREVH